MPTYDYRCKDCGTTHEIQHGFNDERPTTCPTCGGHLVRVFHPVGVVFKGSGFHKTDYSGTSSRGSETSKGDGASAGTSDSSKSDTSTSETGKSETKPATPKAEPAKSDPKSGST